MLIFQLIRERFKGIPWPLLILVYAIVALGIFNLYSASGAEVSPQRFHSQVNFVIVGTFAMFFWGLILDLRTIERSTYLGYVIVCLLLLAVDVRGDLSKGAQRWLEIGPIRLQPSELGKFIIILITARSFSLTKGIYEYTLLTLWRQIFLVGVPFLLVLLQPDLGTAGLIFLIAAAQISFVRIDWKSIAIVGVSGLTAVLLAWNFVLYDYQKMRVLNFINPMRDPKGAGYHSIQSMIAVGSGGFWGRGFQQGTQSQLNFLPERHTDFIFSVWAEEHGFLGCLVLFALYASLIVVLFQISQRAKDAFSAMVTLGVAGFFLFHFLINVSMVLGVFPVVGVPLSLVSYGGTHMITCLSCIGLVVAVERRRVQGAI
jgi:rod shape determining protein RodA